MRECDMWRTSKTLIAASAIVLSIGGAAMAGPCATAKSGTYLSNACWLVENFTKKGLPAKIVSVDEGSCTVKLKDKLWNLMGTYGDTIYFNRADPKDVKIEWNRHTTCWHMVGKNVNGRGFDKVSLCGARIETDRVKKAFRNLYTRHCKGKRSEF